jgi:hypothetical protein
MSASVVYAAFPAYELAALTPKQLSQVLNSLPHNCREPFRQAWKDALRKMQAEELAEAS